MLQLGPEICVALRRAHKFNVALMMEAVRTSETSVYFNELHGSIFQKAAIFTNYIPASCRTIIVKRIEFFPSTYNIIIIMSSSHSHPPQTEILLLYCFNLFYLLVYFSILAYF
jgi:hypothetical protein